MNEERRIMVTIGKRAGKCIAAMMAAAVMVCGVPTVSYGVGPGDMEIGDIGPGTNVDAYGNPVSGVVEKGITVSKYQNRASESQGGIDWAKAKKGGVGFAMVRLGYHNDLDPYFHQNMQDAQEAGIKTGIFFYTQALDVQTAVDEANFVLSQIKDCSISYPVAYDVESNLILEKGLTRQQITDQIKAFCQVIADAGYRPIVYANNEWLNSHIDSSQLVDNSGNPFDIWYARYGTVNEYPNRTIWQCTDSGTVSGIEGNVTIEYSFVDYSSLIPADGWKTVGNDWYYVKNYKNQTGWQKVGEVWYYLGADGKMVHDVTVNIDGVDYTFGSDGSLV